MSQCMSWYISFQSLFYVPKACLKQIEDEAGQPVLTGQQLWIAHKGLLVVLSILPTPKQLICW